MWKPPEKPAELSEARLIDAILDGTFPIDSNLPAERELARLLGVTRPTLREALQRLARDGWLEIRHGKPTRVRNYWQEGSLGVLSAISQRMQHLPPNFVGQLLTIRLLLAPAYANLAVKNAAPQAAAAAEACLNLPETAEAYAQADWNLHLRLTILSGNPVFTLILNGFRELYQEMGLRYFASPDNRAASHAFYRDLAEAAREKDEFEATEVMVKVMRDSIQRWKAVDLTASATPEENA